MSDYFSYVWDTAPEEPSAAGIMQRYASPKRAVATEGVDSSMAPPQPRGTPYERLQWNNELGEVARFALQDLPNYYNQLQRALTDRDFETLHSVSNTIDTFVTDHRDPLRSWELYQGPDPTGQSVATNVQLAATGMYKNKYSTTGENGGNYTVQMALDDDSPETKAKRASDLAKELAIPDTDANALIDRNDPLHVAFGSFGEAYAASRGKKSANQPEGMALAANIKEYLSAAHKFLPQQGQADQQGPTFKSASEFGSFLREFDRQFAADKTVPGRRILEDVAATYLTARDSGQDVDPVDWITKVKALRDNVETALAGDSGGAKKETKERVHEANSYVGAYLREGMALSGGAPIDSAFNAAALASAAKRVAMFSSVYGIDLRDGQSGVSRTVAKAALKLAGVEGADDGGMLDFMGTLMPALDMYGGSDGPLVAKKDANGQESMQPADGSFHDIDSAVRSAAGRTLYSMWRRRGGQMREGGAGRLLQDLAADVGMQNELRDAVSKSLRARFVDGQVADAVAARVYMNPVNQTPVTVADALIAEMKLTDANGAPRIPDNVLIKAKLGSGNEARPEASTLQMLASNPSYVIPVAQGEKEISDSIAQYAKAALKDDGKSDDSSRYHRATELGNMIVKTQLGSGLPEDIKKVGMAARWLPRMVAAASGHDGLLKALVKSDRSIDDSKALAEAVRTGDSDAMLVAALIAERADPAMEGVGVSTGRLAPSNFISGDLDLPKPEQVNVLLPVYEALRQVLGDKNIKRGDNLTSRVLNALKATGRLDGSILVRSGYLDPATGATNENEVLRRLQERQHMDPVAMSDVRTVPAARADAETDPLAIRARRVASSLLNRDTAVGRVQARYSAMLKSLGYTDKEANAMAGTAMVRAGDIYRASGAAGVLQFGEKLMSRRQRFFPTLAKNPRGGGTIDTVNRVDANVMTEEEYLAERERLIASWGPALGYGRDRLDALFDAADVGGRGVWLRDRALQDRMLAARMKALGEKVDGDE